MKLIITNLYSNSNAFFQVKIQILSLKTIALKLHTLLVYFLNVKQNQMLLAILLMEAQSIAPQR